jgi:hypothetical protein
MESLKNDIQRYSKFIHAREKLKTELSEPETNNEREPTNVKPNKGKKSVETKKTTEIKSANVNPTEIKSTNVNPTEIKSANVKTAETDRPAITINDIIAMVKPPMFALKDNCGYVYDLERLALECNFKHRHTYFHSEIVSGNIKCKTCSRGKFTTFIRNILDDVFGRTFSVIGDSDKLSTAGIPLIVICDQSAGVCSVDVGDKITLTIHYTTSAKKVKKNLYDLLMPNIELIKELKPRLDALMPVKDQPKKRWTPAPLEFTPAHAAVTPAGIPVDNINRKERLIFENFMLKLE